MVAVAMTVGLQAAEPRSRGVEAGVGPTPVPAKAPNLTSGYILQYRQQHGSCLKIAHDTCVVEDVHDLVVELFVPRKNPRQDRRPFAMDRLPCPVPPTCLPHSYDDTAPIEAVPSHVNVWQRHDGIEALTL